MRTYRAQAIDRVCAALRGQPRTLTAADANALLLPVWHAALAMTVPPPFSYTTWRRAVRTVMQERARVAAWEGVADVAAIRPLRRKRAA